MNPAQQLHQAGQSLWLDSISRQLLSSGTLARYIEDLAVTGLTSNPTILGHAMAASADRASGRRPEGRSLSHRESNPRRSTCSTVSQKRPAPSKGLLPTPSCTPTRTFTRREPWPGRWFVG